MPKTFETEVKLESKKSRVISDEEPKQQKISEEQKLLKSESSQ